MTAPTFALGTGIDNGQPVVRDLAVRKTGGQWAVLGENLTPQYDVVSGVRRFSSQQGEPLEGRGLLTAERAEKEKWYAYRDAPLLLPGMVPAGGRGGRGGRGGAARPAPSGPPFPYTSPKPEDIKRATATFNSTSCSVKTDGARIRSALQRSLDGDFLRQSPVHGLQGH